ncbi:uncharacterized protein LOC103703859 isoform X2 [Phoenix dactylifera]|uniref:Uncharacterized protein LOC103703859 isoform X2 n=1 Tax=Phoenix dactylifera TaxID=42345 RepID=A0A8B8ZZU0_PHODC|nr:uncharacterized protein LOC103703859 isoform X2 [Phoenix dactylifera]
MDKEKGRDLKRCGSSGRRSSPAKRQQRALSGRISSSTKPISHPSSSPSVLNGSSCGGGGGGDESAMERWQKERAKAFVWGSRINKEDGRTGDEGGCCGSDRGDSRLSRPPLSSSGTVRSKVEDCSAVDLAMVPRKLRSAMNKRSRLSASPSLLDSKNKCRASNGSHVPCVNGSRSFKRDMLKVQITKDEEEAAETLSALASMIPDGRPVKISQEGRMLEENSETTATIFSHSEASKEESTKILLPSTSSAAAKRSSHIEESIVETAKPEPSVLEQPAITGVNQQLDPGSNGTAHPDLQRTPPSKNEQSKNATTRDSLNSLNLLESLNSSNLLEAPLYSYSENKSAQLDALSVHKSEINLWPVGSASSEKHVQPFNQKTDILTHYMHGGDTGHAPRPGMPSSDNGHLTMWSSTKAAAWRDSAAGGRRTSSNGLNSNGSGLPTEKVSADRRSSWKRCTTHVYISHIIQSYQNTEKRHQFLLVTNQAKAKEGMNSGVQACNEATRLSSLNSMTSAGTSGSIMESTDEATTQMLSGSYMQQQQGSYHSLIPFPFAHSPYTSLCLDQLPATTAQQLQLPHHIGNSLYGGPQMVLAGGSTKHQQQQQQQQILQAQMAQYRPPLGIPTWQTMRLQDPSLLPCAQLSREMKVRPYKSPSPQQQQHLLPISSSSFSLRAKKPHGGGFGSEGAPRLQLLCNARRMRRE